MFNEDVNDNEDEDLTWIIRKFVVDLWTFALIFSRWIIVNLRPRIARIDTDSFKQKHWKQLSVMLAMQSYVSVYDVSLWASSYVTAYSSIALRLH